MDEDCSVSCFHRHRLPEVPLPSVCEVQSLPHLLHCDRSEDIHLQLLERWDSKKWLINFILLVNCIQNFHRLVICPLFSSFRPSPQRPVCEQQWLFGFAQQWESQSKLNRSAHPLWVKLIRKFKCVTITECSNDLMSPEKKYYQGGEGCLQSCTGLQKAVSDSV